jgi:hypothetical protein
MTYLAAYVLIQREMIPALLTAVDLSAGEVDSMPLWHHDVTVICASSGD